MNPKWTDCRGGESVGTFSFSMCLKTVFASVQMLEQAKEGSQGLAAHLVLYRTLGWLNRRDVGG